MDDLSSKLKKLFKPKPKAFKGKGSVLGRNEQVKLFPRAFEWRGPPFYVVNNENVEFPCSEVIISQAAEPQRSSSTAAPRSRPTYSDAQSPKQPIPPGRRLGTAESNLVPERQKAGLRSVLLLLQDVDPAPSSR